VRLTDQFDRPLGSLRISVTDRCNLRCRYCMPAAAYAWLPTASLLSFDEITRLARLFVAHGVAKLRLTGGEPLLRPGLDELVGQLAAIGGVDDLALTTNATRLAAEADSLHRAGLKRLTISLDTLRPERMEALARADRTSAVVEGIDAARQAGFTTIKLNTVVMRGVNDDEIIEIVRFATSRGLEARFIEYMDVGGALEWRAEAVVPRAEILSRLEATFGPLAHLARAGDPSAPAERWRLPDGTVVGIVASTTTPFCGACDRSRLTADGMWYRCLYAEEGIDLATPLRSGAGDEELAAIITSGWQSRHDRGAEQRAAQPGRAPLVPLTRLQQDPRLEMHVRGG
jgi:cyclic pyranopterin phosphate synthase